MLQCPKIFKIFIASKAEQKLVLVSNNMNLGLYLIFCRHILKTSVHILDTSLHFCASLHVFSFCSEVQIYETSLKNLKLPLYCLCNFFWFIIIAHHGNCFCVHLCVYCSVKVVWKDVYIPSRERNNFLFIFCLHKSRCKQSSVRENNPECWQLLPPKLLLQSWVTCYLSWMV